MVKGAAPEGSPANSALDGTPSWARSRVTTGDDGLPHTITDPLHKTKALSWNAFAQLTRYEDCSGRVTTYDYDDRQHMIAVTDADSIGAMRALSHRLGRWVGGSTGTNLWACAHLVAEMAAAGESGSIVTLLCDSGDRYATTYYDDDWLAARSGFWTEQLDALAGAFGDPAPERKQPK